jgi:hypothetical protein
VVGSGEETFLEILDVVSRGERASGIPALRSAAAMRTGDLKNWLRGTHHGVDSKHLPAYLDEFAFCFNRRRSPMAAFQSLLGHRRSPAYHSQDVVRCGVKQMSRITSYPTRPPPGMRAGHRRRHVTTATTA